MVLTKGSDAVESEAEKVTAGLVGFMTNFTCRLSAYEIRDQHQLLSSLRNNRNTFTFRIR